MKSHSVVALFAVATAMWLANTAQAGLLEIQLSGVNLTYSDPDGAAVPDNGTLTDAAVGPDPLTGIDFFEDGNLIQSLPTVAGESLGLSFGAIGIPTIAVPAPGSSTSVTTAAGGMLDLLVDNSSILSLDLDEVEVVYTNLSFGMFQVRLQFIGGLGDIVSQDLPFSMDARSPIALSFSMQGTATQSNGVLTNFVGSGTGELRGEMVPEPSTVAMLGLGGLMSLMVYSRYKLG